MRRQTPLEPVRKVVEVRAAREEAFRTFVDQIDVWWPLATHSVGGGESTGCFFEGRNGGRIYETSRGGGLSLWGTVTAWDPPIRIVFSWHPGRDASTAQEVELRFEPTERGTRVELEHRRWELLGERAEAIREGYRTGWDPVLARFVAQCGGAVADRAGTA